MPVCIGGGVHSLQDINDLLLIGADKIVMKKQALLNPEFIKESSDFFGSQCIVIAIDVKKINGTYKIFNSLGLEFSMVDYIKKVQDLGAGEIILNNVDYDGMMCGFDIELFKLADEVSRIPIVYAGGGGNLAHYQELFSLTNCSAVGSSSIFHFTQFTPLDIKNTLQELGKPVRLS